MAKNIEIKRIVATFPDGLLSEATIINWAPEGHKSPFCSTKVTVACYMQCGNHCRMSPGSTTTYHQFIAGHSSNHRLNGGFAHSKERIFYYPLFGHVPAPSALPLRSKFQP